MSMRIETAAYRIAAVLVGFQCSIGVAGEPQVGAGPRDGGYYSDPYGFFVKRTSFVKACFDRDNMNLHGINFVPQEKSCKNSQAGMRYSLSAYWALGHINDQEFTNNYCNSQPTHNSDLTFSGLHLVYCESRSSKSALDQITLLAERTSEDGSLSRSVNYFLTAYCPPDKRNDCDRGIREIISNTSLTAMR